MTEPPARVAAAMTLGEEQLMARALVLARRGIGLTDPNPSVGCVIARNGQIVGEGTTAPAGGPHAEIAALNQAGELAAGASVYVTLEPCAHQGRTGPCSKALIDAGVKRVVAACVDPNPRVNGRGLADLERAGIAVAHGYLERSAREVNPGYWSRFERGRPWLRLKIAASLDGRTALANGRSQWITSESARADVHQWRARSSAVMTGIGTVLADDPALTARPSEQFAFAPPTRIVVDSSLRTPLAAKLFDLAGDVVVVHVGEMPARAALLRARGARVESVPGGPRVDLVAAMARLAELEVNTVWVEAGATLGGALLEAGLVDQLLVYLAPAMLGAEARGMADVGPLSDLADRLRLRFDDIRRIGPDLRIIASPDTLPAD